MRLSGFGFFGFAAGFGFASSAASAGAISPGQSTIGFQPSATSFAVAAAVAASAAAAVRCDVLVHRDGPILDAAYHFQLYSKTSEASQTRSRSTNGGFALGFR